MSAGTIAGPGLEPAKIAERSRRVTARSDSEGNTLPGLSNQNIEKRHGLGYARTEARRRGVAPPDTAIKRRHSHATAPDPPPHPRAVRRPQGPAESGRRLSRA